jgi:hypothetical protein
MTVKELKDILAEYGDEYNDCLVTCYCTSPVIGYANVINRAYIGKTYVNKPSNYHYWNYPGEDKNWWPIKRTLQLQFEIPKSDIEELKNE